ncbi:MAG: DUF1501 domain-containing protein [Verrucomicrobiae bacterium]|nr:DUF1501 domain-containing protein [Verrucomicrobiae bacterium]
MSLCRRDFIRAATFAALVPPVFRRAAAAVGQRRTSGDPTALVVVQLSGGNDGLNCVVPFAHDEYARRRHTLRLMATDVLKINDELGFHPALADWKRLFDEGLACVVQGVGYPKSSRNHPEAMRDWHTARPGDANWPTGWVGQIADQLCARDPAAVPAALITPSTRPGALTAEHAIIPSIHKLEDLTPPPCESRLRSGNPLLEHVSEVSAAAAINCRAIQTAALRSGNYPPTPFARGLRIAASLIRADVGFRILYLELGGGDIGGFDNHAAQKDNHAALLRQFAAGVAAFIDDLRRDGLLERVLLMTISEFGRTLAENGRRGTDHGAAAPMFLAGGRLKGGLIGAHPDLNSLDNGGLRPHTDFRQVYATVFEQWLGLDPLPILGGRFDQLDLFRA